MESRWLRCKVLPGMFSTERLVVIEDPTRGEVATILVDASFVRVAREPELNVAVPGELRVETSGGRGRVNIMLPVASAEMGRVVSLPAELLTA